MCVPAGVDLDLDLDPDLDPDLDDSSSVVTAGGSDEQQDFSDSASFSIPSLELSDGPPAAASSKDMEDSRSLSCSAPGPGTSSSSTGVPGLKEEGVSGADGEASSAGEKTNRDSQPFFLGCF